MKYTKEKKPLFRCFILPALLLCLHLPVHLGGQERGLTATGTSPHLRLRSVNIGDVTWTDGFWAERFRVCSGVMVPRMMGCYLNPEVSHAFRNFEIAAGLAEGDHQGPAFHDGDFYKMLEAEIMVWAASRDQKLETEIDRIIAVIGKAQRADGYLHTPALIKAAKNPGSRYEFTRRLDFETYNLGHLMTAACIHHRVTGKNTLLEIARKATRFLVEFSRTAPEELAGNTICPSNYMGVAEMYRTTGDPAFLELAKKLMEIRSLVKEGTDHNQDRIPFKQQTTAVGHAVRANYLYAGAADLYAETGDDSLLTALEKSGTMWSAANYTSQGPAELSTMVFLPTGPPMTSLRSNRSTRLTAGPTSFPTSTPITNRAPTSGTCSGTGGCSSYQGMPPMPTSWKRSCTTASLPPSASTAQDISIPTPSAWLTN